MRLLFVFLCLFLASSLACAKEQRVILSYGFVRKIRCEGRLFVSSIGNQDLIFLQALPAELGCGVIIKPLQKTGSTNLLLETSTGTIGVLIEISSASGASLSHEVALKAGDSR